MTTAFDIDNTLAATDKEMLRLLNAKFGTHYKASQLFDYRVELSLGLDDEQASFVRDLFKSEDFYRDIPAIAGARAAVQAISDQDDVIYVTARPSPFADVTVEWLSSHYFPVGDVFVGPSEKVEALLRCGVEAYVDDYPTDALYAAELGISVYMPAYRWNAHVNHPNVTRFADWADVLLAIEEGTL